ncbi:MAG: ATPase [Clostridiales bacterium]
MDIYDVIDNLEDNIESSVKLPLVSKSIINKDEFLEFIKQIRLSLPDDIKKAAWIKQEEQLIIEKANKEADKIISEAENKVVCLIEENDITKKAYEQASGLIESAQKNSREIKVGTKQYADKILVKVEDVLRDTLNIVKANRSELKE